MRKASNMTDNKVSFEDLFLLGITEKLFLFLSWIYSCLSFLTTQTWKQAYREQSCVENCNRSDFVCFPIYSSDILYIRNVVLCRISMFSSYFLFFTSTPACFETDVGCATGSQEMQSDGYLALYSNTVESWSYRIFMWIYAKHLHKSFSPGFHHCKIPSCEHCMDIHMEQKHLQTASHPLFLSYQKDSNILMLFLLYAIVKRGKTDQKNLHR